MLTPISPSDSATHVSAYFKAEDRYAALVKRFSFHASPAYLAKVAAIQV